jgi:hypothetical protein
VDDGGVIVGNISLSDVRGLDAAAGDGKGEASKALDAPVAAFLSRHGQAPRAPVTAFGEWAGVPRMPITNADHASGSCLPFQPFKALCVMTADSRLF